MLNIIDSIMWNKVNTTINLHQKVNSAQRISPSVNRKMLRIIKESSMVTREDIQVDLGADGASVTGRAISNELYRNSFKSRNPWKTHL